MDGLDFIGTSDYTPTSFGLGSGVVRQSIRSFSKDSSNKSSISTAVITSKKNDPPSDKTPLGPTKPDPSISPDTTTTLHELKRFNETKRLVVKRTTAVDDIDTSEIIKKPFDFRQRIGIVNRRFPLDHEITDSGGKTIWIPVKTMVNSNHNHNSNNNSNDRSGEIKLPQINASAWLDPSAYCRGGGKTIAGTVAARQLLHGKKDLMEVLGHAVYSSTSKLVQRHRSIILCGHGVPPQLLQHHIDAADKLLLHLNASEVSFKQFNVSQSDNVTAMDDAVRDLRWGHVRDAETGENRVITWPISDSMDWGYDLQLYWTVMNRIATRLGLPVLLQQPQATISKPEVSTRRLRAEYNIPALLHSSMLHVPPHHWRVKFSRDWHFSPHQFPTARSHIYPVVEWTPLEGVATPGHVCIRLQGLVSTSNDPIPISLCFDASFRSNSVSSMEKD